MLSPYILFTALAAQFIFILINWYFFKRKEYIYYLCYIAVISLYFINKYVADDLGMVHVFPFSYNELYPDKILAILGYIMYFRFGRHFIEAQTRYPAMNRHIKTAELALFGYIIFNIFLLSVTHSFELEKTVFLPLNIALSLFLIYIFTKLLQKNEVLDRFILLGSIYYAVCATVTVWLGHAHPAQADNAFTILQVGTLMEMIFLNAGIMYKSKMLQKQTIDTQKQLIDRYVENQELLLRLTNIREKISRDLHDDVGATLSSIKAYAQILKDNPANPLISDLINSNSDDMIEKLEVIAWATDPSHDNLKSLLYQMKKFAIPLFHSKDIEFKLKTGNIKNEMLIPGEVRQNLLFMFKEAVNNIVKYAGAGGCVVTIDYDNAILTMQIHDNGRGCDGTIKGGGNGLRNMEKRAAEINGKIQINGSGTKGTQIFINVPLPVEIPNTWEKNQESIS